MFENLFFHPCVFLFLARESQLLFAFEITALLLVLLLLSVLLLTLLKIVVNNAFMKVRPRQLPSEGVRVSK